MAEVMLDTKLETQTRSRIFWHKVVSQRQLIFMSFPFLIHLFIFAYSPIWGWLMAFQNYKPMKSFFEQEWVGLQQFKFLFFDEGFLRVLRNTIAMSMINMTLGFITAITLAVLLNEIKNVLFKRSVQTISYLPHFLSWIIVTGLVANCLSTENGIVNVVLMKLRLIEEPVLWLSKGEYFWWIIGFTYVWKEVGWNTIIYLAAMAAIDPALYEAAEVDGATRFQKIIHITLPGIKSTFMVLLIMAIGNTLNAGFEMQYLLGNPQVIDWSETIDIFTLKYGIQIGNYSLATAAGMFKSVVNITLLFMANHLAKRLGEERLI
ncbi:MAG TPA: sugar ABC transporter permease [Firmicutes bacterium]|nr:sugar ABC transporter permease [Bacillota bacterium]